MQALCASAFCPLRVREPRADGIIWSQTEDLREMVASAVDPALDRAHGDVLTGSDFLIAQALDANQQEDLALPRRQLGQRLREILQLQPGQLLRQRGQTFGIGAFDILDLPLPFPVLGVKVVLQEASSG